MELRDKTCAIERFSTAQALVKTGFDVGPVTDVFHSEIARHLSKQGLLIQESHPSLGQQDITVEGQFVLIDEGNRVLRYFLTGLAGNAVLEVEGKLFHEDIPVTDLYAKATQTAGIFGGSSQKLLKICAAAAARQVSNQVLEALRDR